MATQDYTGVFRWVLGYQRARTSCDWSLHPLLAVVELQQMFPANTQVTF